MAMTETPVSGARGTGASTCLPPPPPIARQTYVAILTWSFTLFSSLRAVSYFPTIWAIYVSGDSSQHSLWTWCIWLGANLTMAAWLYEQNGRCLSRAVVVNLGNSTMCVATAVLIAVYRILPA